MRRRESRARLLAPSFLIVTTGWGCGKTLWSTDAEPGTELVNAAGASFEAAPKCPASLPVSGAVCAESQRCEYPEPDPACGGLITNYEVAECVDGAWAHSFRFGGSCNPPGPMPPMPPVACPTDMPPLGAACPPNYAPSACAYQLPECANPITVACAAGTWQSRDVCTVLEVGGAGPGGGAAGESGAAGASEGGRAGEGS